MDEFGDIDSGASLDSFDGASGFDDCSVDTIPDMPDDSYEFAEVEEPVEDFEPIEDSFDGEEFPDMPEDDYELEDLGATSEGLESVEEPTDLTLEFPDMSEGDVEPIEEPEEIVNENEELSEGASEDIDELASDDVADFSAEVEDSHEDASAAGEIPYEENLAEEEVERAEPASESVFGESDPELFDEQIEDSVEQDEVYEQESNLDEPIQEESLDAQEIEGQDAEPAIAEGLDTESADENTSDAVGELSEADELSAEGEIPAEDGKVAAEGGYSSLSEYMNAHNYGADDFSEYSKDPEWQRLHELEYPGECGFSSVSEYMNAHNYGIDDYSEYSKDPEWQRLHELEYPEEHSGELSDLSSVDEESDQLEFDEAEQTGTISQNSPEISPEIGGVSPETVSEYAPSIPVDTEAWDSLSDVPFAGDPESMVDADAQPETTWDDLSDVPFTGDAESVADATEQPETTWGDLDEAPFAGNVESVADMGEQPETAWDDLGEVPFAGDTESAAETGEFGYEASEVSDEIGGTGPLTPSQALENMDAYMAEHGYGASDYLEYSQDSEWQSLNNDLIAADTGIEPMSADGGMEQASLESMFPGRVYNEFEQSVLEQNPEFYETGKFYEQGVNEFGYQGTCGPTSQANALNQLMETNAYTENDILALAKDNGLCDVVEGCPEASGGTTPEQFMDLYEKVSEQSGGAFHAECFDFDDALSAEEVANKLDQGAVVNVAVDSKTLWGERSEGFDPLNVWQIAEASDHWITVSGVQRDASGGISGFDIIDSGGGESYVSLDKYNDMCFGTNEHLVTDPTCIVVEKTTTAETVSGNTDFSDMGTKNSKSEAWDNLSTLREFHDVLTSENVTYAEAQSISDAIEANPAYIIEETDGSGSDEHPQSDPQLALDYGSTTRKR